MPEKCRNHNKNIDNLMTSRRTDGGKKPATNIYVAQLGAESNDFFKPSSADTSCKQAWIGCIPELVVTIKLIRFSFLCLSSLVLMCLKIVDRKSAQNTCKLVGRGRCHLHRPVCNVPILGRILSRIK